ncbi:MAG: hypothetical protein NTX75_01470 [Proteobacteria bacterium]|nr:hypothetical protein [Pseudomonadota bacterium]
MGTIEGIEILKNYTAGNYVGYFPQTIYTLTGMPIGWDTMVPLKRIPLKISNFFNNFVEVRRFCLKDDFSKNQYFFKATSGKFFEVLY